MAGRRRRASAGSFWYRSVGQGEISRSKGDAGTAAQGGGLWQRTTAYVLGRPVGAYGTVRMAEGRGHGIAPRFRSIAGSRRWSPIPRGRIPFSPAATRV